MLSHELQHNHAEFKNKTRNARVFVAPDYADGQVALSSTNTPVAQCRILQLFFFNSVSIKFQKCCKKETQNATSALP